MIDLARRAVACKHWKWLGGTSVVCPAAHDGATGYTFRVESTCHVLNRGEYPDLTDKATLGCLLALVREAWNEDYVSTRYSEYVEGGEWDVPVRVQNKGYRTVVFFKGATEAEALVAALEAAT